EVLRNRHRVRPLGDRSGMGEVGTDPESVRGGTGEMKQSVCLTVAIVIASLWAGCATKRDAQPSASGTVTIGNGDIGGVVTGPGGPEAGAWVIAETIDLPTKFARIVVTDDQGRYLIPDLPRAKYKIWVRGYGLVDSPKVGGAPGATLHLTDGVTPNEAAAAQYYPAIYWYSMLKIPETSQFDGKHGIPDKLTQSDCVTQMKNSGCSGSQPLC